MSEARAEPPDEILVVAAIVGDLDAFDQLALRYRAAVVRVARAIVGREHAEDVAQDVLLLAFRALPSIEEPRKFPAWLAAITRHRAARFGKRERERQSRRVVLGEKRIPSGNRTAWLAISFPASRYFVTSDGDMTSELPTFMNPSPAALSAGNSRAGSSVSTGARKRAAGLWLGVAAAFSGRDALEKNRVFSRRAAVNREVAAASSEEAAKEADRGFEKVRK